MNFAFVFLMLFISGIGVLISSKRDSNWRSSVNPIALLIPIYLAYSLSPVFGQYADHLGDGGLYSYISVQLIGLVGLVVGSVLSIAPQVQKIEVVYEAKFPKIVSDTIVLFSLVGFLLGVHFIFNGLGDALMVGYTATMGDDLMVGGLDMMIFYLIVFYGFPALLTVDCLVRGYSVVWCFSTFVYCTIMYLLGLRNYLTMYVGAIFLVHAIRHGRPSYFRLGIFAFIGAIVLMAGAIYRTYGLGGLGDVVAVFKDEGVSAINPSQSEFGTTYNVFSIHQQNPLWWTGYPGESYVRILYSMIPRYFWSDRPEAIGMEFSNYFANKGEGLGFSMNLDALVNFGLIGVLLVNATIGVFWQKVYTVVLRSGGALSCLLYFNLVLFALNSNRIDTQTVFKLTLVRLAFSFVVWMVFVRLKKIHDPVFRAPLSK